MDKETSEIAKLTERVSKDIKSKLFVPLAEEYKKAGDLDMAIHVLSEGLKNNPSYVTARSVLGKLLLEKGDLSRAQIEFQEVVKTIPDNILAQRKLGDLFVLQNRPDEALKQYKVVLALNPRDEEVGSLVSDIEAGRDVRLRLPQPKPQSVPETSVHQELPAVSQAREEEEEEAEEVLVVEPLEDVLPGLESIARDFDFLTEKDQGDFQTPSGAEHLETPFAASEGHDEELIVQEHLRAEAVSMPEAKSETIPSLADEMPVGSDFVKAEIAEETPEANIAETSGEVIAVFPEVVAAEATDAALEQSDDFTTDTLAELYIAQGFHEKAIDIYQRMLADKPDSKGLKDKLERVRAMAAQAGQLSLEEAELKSEIFDESQEEHPALEVIEKQRGDDLAAESREYGLVSEKDEEQKAESNQGPGSGASPFAQEESGKKPVYAEFDAQEYVPQTAKFATGALETEEAYSAAKPSQTHKQVTIARLETWLNNIKKEK